MVESPFNRGGFEDYWNVYGGGYPGSMGGGSFGGNPYGGTPTGGGSPTPTSTVTPGGATLPNEGGGVQTYTPTPEEIEQQRREEAMARFYRSPDYDFRFNEGVRAMDSSAAARGMLMSGAQLRGITDFGQNLAAGEYGNYINRLSGIAGLAQTPQNPYAGTQASLYGGLMGAYGQAGANQANIQGNNANAQAGLWGNVLGGIDWGGVAKGIGGMF